MRLSTAVGLAVLTGVAIAAVAEWVLFWAFHPQAGGTSVDVTKLALTIVGGVGGVVALVIAYRRQRDLEQGRFVERFGAAAAQLGAGDVAVRMAGVYAMAGAVDESDGPRRQQCIDVLCGYLRLPYAPDLGANHQTKLVLKHHHARADGTLSDDEEHHLEYRQNDREVRKTITRVIAAHLRPDAQYSWSDNDFDFRTAYLVEVDFRGATFSGTADFGSATFSGDARFDSATFSGNYALFDSATFSGTAWFESATFSGDAWFGLATFGRDAWFKSATFSGDARFDSATFGRDTRFDSATFSGTAWFESVTFSGGDARFDSATFSRDARFEAATFSGGARFREATFSGGAGFREATFSGPAVFDSARFDSGDFTGAYFGAERVSFEGVRKWGPVFDWDSDVSKKPDNVLPQVWPRVSKAPDPETPAAPQT